MSKPAFIKRLCKENQDFYGTPKGGGVLQTIKRNFDHNWIYLFELLQNALDAGAKRVAIKIGSKGKSLTFQHDGVPLEEDNVQSLSEVGRSTKGTGKVGFMGVGFKSVFVRFNSVGVSGGGWQFEFDVKETKGKLGETNSSLIGMVSPQWNVGVPSPTSGFTTRFELSKQTGESSLDSDLAHLPNDQERNILVPLRLQGLEQIEINGSTWILHSEDTSWGQRITATHGKTKRYWQCFEAKYRPSAKAARAFLEHRSSADADSEREDEKYREAKKERKVVAFYRVDEENNPVNANESGRAFAVLPTDVELPIGLNIQADWLLNLSRTGTKDFEEDDWQLEILDRIPRLIAEFLRWVTAESGAGPDWENGYLALPDIAGEHSHPMFRQWLASKRFQNLMKSQLAKAKVFPCHHDSNDVSCFKKPAELALLPGPLSEVFDNNIGMKGWILFGSDVIDRKTLGERGTLLLETLGLVTEVNSKWLGKKWGGGIGYWVDSIQEVGEPSQPDDGDDIDASPTPRFSEAQAKALVTLWGALQELEDVEESKWKNDRLKCLPARSGRWKPQVDLNRLENFDLLQDAPLARQAVENYQPPEKDIFDEAPFANRCDWNDVETYSADNFLESIPTCNLNDIISNWCEQFENASHVLTDADVSAIVQLTRITAKNERYDLIKMVLVEGPFGLQLVSPENAVVASPYVSPIVGDLRTKVFFNCLPVAGVYVQDDELDVSRAELAKLFETLGSQGPVRSENFSETVQGPAKVDEFCGKELGLTGFKKYRLIDSDWKPRLLESLGQSLSEIPFADWLSKEDIPEDYHKRVIQLTPHETKYESQATWITRLVEWEWIPCLDGRHRRPAEVLNEADAARPDAPVAKLPSDFLRLLTDELGIEFGQQISDAPAILKLDVRGATMSDDEMAVTLEEAFEMARRSEEDKRSFLAAIERPIFRDPKTDKRYPVSQLVQKVGSGSLRSDLGGFVLAVNSLSSEPLRNAVGRLPSVPSTTSGTQALCYLRSVWNGVSQRPETSADQVRRILPLAYRYVADDIDSGDDELRATLEQFRSEAFAFANGQWISTNDPRVLLDDLQDKQLRRQLGDGHLWVTPGHFGEELPQQKKTATLLGVKALSDQIERTVIRGSSSSHPDWIERFKTVCALFREIQMHETDGRESPEEDAVKRAFNLTLRPFESLKLETQQSLDESLELPDIDIRARLSENDEFLDVAGEPDEFGADACAQLVKLWGQNQVAVAPERLTSLLVFLDDGSKFNRQIVQLRQQYNLGSEPVGSQTGPALPTAVADAIKDLGIPDPTPPIADPTGPEPRGTDTGALGVSGPRRNASGGSGTSGSGTGRHGSGGAGGAGRNSSGTGSGSKGNSGTKGRLNGKGSRAFISYVATDPNEEEPDPDGLQDEARKTLEKKAIDLILAREPQLKRTPTNNPGFDLFELNGEDEIIRRVEVKAMTGDLHRRPVGVSREQFDCAREHREAYWLYVVEHADDPQSSRIVRIQDPAGKARTFCFDHGWISVAAIDGAETDDDDAMEETTNEVADDGRHPQDG